MDEIRRILGISGIELEPGNLPPFYYPSVPKPLPKDDPTFQNMLDEEMDKIKKKP